MKENTKVKIAYFYSIGGDGINSGKLPDSEDIWARSFRKGSKKKSMSGEKNFWINYSDSNWKVKETSTSAFLIAMFFCFNLLSKISSLLFEHIYLLCFLNSLYHLTQYICFIFSPIHLITCSKREFVIGLTKCFAST